MDREEEQDSTSVESTEVGLARGGMSRWTARMGSTELQWRPGKRKSEQVDIEEEQNRTVVEITK